MLEGSPEGLGLGRASRRQDLARVYKRRARVELAGGGVLVEYAEDGASVEQEEMGSAIENAIAGF